MRNYEIVELIADEQPRLARELAELPVEAWKTPSRCEGWTNARVVAHLALGAELYRDCVSRALNGDIAAPAGPDGQRMTVEEVRSQFRSRNDALVQRVPNELMELLIRSGEELLDLYRRLVPEDSDRPAWHPSGILTIGTFLAYRVGELGLHGWDIRGSVDPDAGLHSELCPFLVDMVRQGQPRFCRPDNRLIGTCRFEIDGQLWTVRVADGKIEMDSPSAVSDAVIRTDASTFVLLATSRRALAECVNRVHLDGEHPQAEQLLNATCFRL